MWSASVRSTYVIDYQLAYFRKSMECISHEIQVKYSNMLPCSSESDLSREPTTFYYAKPTILFKVSFRMQRDRWTLVLSLRAQRRWHGLEDSRFGTRKGRAGWLLWVFRPMLLDECSGAVDRRTWEWSLVDGPQGLGSCDSLLQQLKMQLCQLWC